MKLVVALALPAAALRPVQVTMSAAQNRRAFVIGGTAAAAAAATKANAYSLPDLPYAYDALEPYIDAETMKLHYSKHAAGYVKGLNAAMGELKKARDTGDYGLVQYWSNKLTFNGGGHTLHTIFWSNMKPQNKGGGGDPTGPLKRLVEKSFGSVDAMKKQFTAAAASVEGSGWGIMALDMMSGDLLIYQAQNQQKLTTWASMPVLVCDVWEHAYYLKYQNRRKDYIDAWWNVVNWDDVAGRVSWHMAT